VIKAFQEVSSALVALDQLAGAEQDLASVGHALDRYLYGLSSYLEVLDAEERLYPIQNAPATARLDRLRAYVQLYKALGGGWNLPGATLVSGAPSRK
jgi:multidrug efflux system outer membrane protein